MKRKLSDDQIEQLIAWRERGWSYRRIAQRLGVSDGAIQYQCLKHAAVSPHQRFSPTPATQTIRRAGDGRIQRTFTPDENRKLIELEGKGLSYSEISRRMERAKTSVRMRLMTLALREDLPGAPAVQ